MTPTVRITARMVHLYFPTGCLFDPGGSQDPLYFGARGLENVLEPQVPLVAAVFEDLLRVVSGQRHRERERLRPDLRVVERHFPLHRFRRGWREALGQRELLAVVTVVVAEVRAVGEVLRLDDQCVAVPSPARIAEIFPDLLAHSWPVIERDDPRLMNHLVTNRH